MERPISVFYPQDELTTMLLPVTVGCPHNRCTFCSMYKDEKYESVPLSEIEFQLMHGYEYTEKLFLTGADPLSVGFDRMSKILKLVNKHLKYCARVASYASVRSILKYTEEQLSILHNLGLRLLYIGFESGDDEILSFINKGSTVKDSLKAAEMLNKVQLPFNSIIMYGIGGHGNYESHAAKTAELLNSFKSRKIITMNLTIFDNTPLAHLAEEGKFTEESNSEKLLEIKLLLENLNLKSETLFDTTHPTNMVKLKGNLPNEKDRLLKEIGDMLKL